MSPRDGTAAPRAVLAIDTATSAGAVALLAGKRDLRRPIEWRASFRAVAPAVTGLLAEAGIGLAELEAIAIPAGPGSFTGLRVGAALALGLCRLSGPSLHLVPTLAAVAEAFAAPGARRVAASLDARRGRRYAAVYERAAPGVWELVRGPLDGTPEELARLGEDAPPAAPEGRPSDGAIAAALARIAAADPRTALASPGELRLVYARPAVDPP